MFHNRSLRMMKGNMNACKATDPYITVCDMLNFLYLYVFWQEVTAPMKNIK